MCPFPSPPPTDGLHFATQKEDNFKMTFQDLNTNFQKGQSLLYRRKAQFRAKRKFSFSEDGSYFSFLFTILHHKLEVR